MARKEMTIVIEKGRDKDKVFFITEFSAARAEDWAIRAFMGMARSGAEIPADVKDAGVIGVMLMGMKALGSMAYIDAKPLLDEMLECIQIIPDARVKAVKRSLIEEDIEEVTTLLQLRKGVFELHSNFSEFVARYRLEQAKEEEENMQNTKTSTE